MISRAVLVAACFVAAAGETYNLQCTPASAGTCGGKCCAVMWTLGGTAGSYTCSQAGEATCGLCGQDDVPSCSYTADNMGVSYPELLDLNKNPVPTAAPTPAPTTGGFVIGGANSISTDCPTPAATTPGSAVTLHPGTYNGMAGWSDIPNSFISGLSEFLLGLTATVPSYYQNSGFIVKYSCAPGNVGCSIFFFVYSCPPCDSTDGGVPAQLAASEDPLWYAGNCGPLFKLCDHEDAAWHQFAVWQAETAAGQDVEVVLSGPATLMFWALVGTSVVCSSKLSEAGCGAAPDNCVWLEDDMVCRPRGCPMASPHVGPSEPRCSVCVSDEEEFLPEVNL